MYSCAVKSTFNPKYSDIDVRNSSLAIINPKSLESILTNSEEFLNENEILLPIPILGAVQDHSKFGKIFYADLSHDLEVKSKVIPFNENDTTVVFSPINTNEFILDSLKSDYVLIVFSIEDTLNPYNKIFHDFDFKNFITKPSSFPIEENEIKTEYQLKNIRYQIWDNKDGEFVRYGRIEYIKAKSYRELIYQTARYILGRSPLYKIGILR